MMILRTFPPKGWFYILAIAIAFISWRLAFSRPRDPQGWLVVITAFLIAFVALAILAHFYL